MRLRAKNKIVSRLQLCEYVKKNYFSIIIIYKIIGNIATYCLFGLFFLLITNCGLHDPGDARKIPPGAKARVEKNIQEGKGFRLKNVIKKGTGTFDFATSNEMWRASLELLDFTPLHNVDYSGGIIITDWFGDKNGKDFIKITIRFLSNEIRADGLEIYIYKKKCNTVNNCVVRKISSSLEQELKVAILKKAAILQKETTAYKRKIIRKRRGTVLDVDNQKAKGP